MLLALALCFLSSLGPPAPAASAADVEVRVIDSAGRPVAGMQVVLESRPYNHALRVAPAVSDAQGIATLAGALDVVRNDAAHSYSARLILPSASEVRADLDRAHVDERSATLVVPALGVLVLRLPESTPQLCRVRVFVLGAARPGAIPERLIGTLREVEIRAGRARLERVGLGLGFEYEVLGLGSSLPAVGRFAGPTRAGEVVTIEVPAPPPELRVLARLVDEDGKPLANASVEWRSTGASEFPARHCECDRGVVTLDGQGRLALPIGGARLDTIPPGKSSAGRTLFLGSPPGRFGSRSDDVLFVRLNVPPFRTGADLDLGVLRLSHFGSPRRYQEIDDAMLEDQFLRVSDMGPLGFGGDVHTELLCEMLRRGSQEFERFLSGVLQGLAEKPRFTCEADDLLLRTALFRLRGQPDPLTVRLRGSQDPELELPGSTELVFEIENSAPENGALLLPIAGAWPWPAIEILDASGRRVPQPISKCAPERSGWSPLAPGESRELRVKSESFSLPGPGDYRVRVHCSPRVALDRLESLAGQLYFSSSEFTLHVRAQSVR